MKERANLFHACTKKQHLACRVVNMVLSGAAFMAARRGRKEDIAQANFVNNLVSAVTAYWLEEGAARWFEMSGSTCAVVATVLFARPGKARTALGAILSVGDLVGCVGVMSYTAGKSPFFYFFLRCGLHSGCYLLTGGNT